MPTDVIKAVLEGKNKILFVRKFGTADTVKRPLLQTEHTFSYSRDLNSVVTKDGRAIAVGALETEIEMTILQAKNDPAQTNIKTAVIKGEKYEIWEVTVDEELKTVDLKYPAVYCQGYFGTWEETATSEDGVELSTTLTVEYEPQFGETVLTADEVELIQYLFTAMGEQPVNSPLYVAGP